MDPLSHAVLGAAFAMSFEKEEKNYLDENLRPKYGLILLSTALISMSPDLDSLIRSNVDQLLYVQFHRHFTHSLLMIPVISFFVAGLLYLLGLRKYASFYHLWKWGTLGLCTHGFLDACTSYGTHLLWPFSDRRESWSIISIIDPVFTVPLIIGVALSAWKKKKIFALSSLCFAILYLSFGVVQHFRARNFYQSQLRDVTQQEIHWVQVKPTIANLWVWRALSLEGQDYRVDGVRIGLFQKSQMYWGQKIEPYDPDKDLEFSKYPLIKKDLKRFEFFSENLLYRVPEKFSGEQRWIGDLRYSLLPHSLEPLWVVILPEAPYTDAHLPFEFTREVNLAKRELYIKMLKGAPISQEELDAF